MTFCFRLALRELHTSSLFEGEPGDRVFSHNIDLLEQGHFRLAGRLVAASLSQDGPGPRFFNKTWFQIATTQWDGELQGNVLPGAMGEIYKEVS